MKGKPRICDLVLNNKNVLVWREQSTYRAGKLMRWTEQELEILERRAGTMQIKQIHQKFFYYRTFQSVRNKIYRI
jgi:hypothetical protein